MAWHYQDDETCRRYKATWRSLFWVLALAGLIRAAFLFATFENLHEDPDAYRKLADNVVETGVYGWRTTPSDEAAGQTAVSIRPTAFRPPLYPSLLVMIGGNNSVWPIAALHWMLGVATVGLVACVGWRAGLGRWSMAGALLVALDPILLQQSTLVMTETLATFLATLTLFCLSGKMRTESGWSAIWPCAGAGIVLGLCVLCRPTFLPWLGLIAVARIVPWYRTSGKSVSSPPQTEPASRNGSRVWQLADMAVLVGTALVVIAPWVVRNYAVLGQAKVTTTHGGYTVLLGNNPLFYRFLKSDSTETWDGEQLSRAWRGRSLTTGPTDEQWDDLRKLASTAAQQPVRDTSELDDDDLAYALAKRYIREQPAMFVYASGLRISRLWRWMPHRVQTHESAKRTALRYLVGLWYALVMGLAILGLARLGREIFARPWLDGLLLCFIFTAVHAIYWSDMRMRAPLMPFLCVAAASGLAHISGMMNRRNS